MTDSPADKSGNRASFGISPIVGAAAFMIVVAGIIQARSLVVQLLLAVFIAIILSQPMQWLEKKGVPAVLAMLIVFVALGLAIAGIALTARQPVLDGTQQIKQLATEFTEAENFKLPTITIGERKIDLAKEFGDDLKKVAETLSATIQGLLLDVVGLFSNAFLILVTVVFILFEAVRFPVKLRAAFGSENAALANLDTILENIRHYMVLKTVTSFLTGVLVAIFTSVIGLGYPFLWGLLAFLLNYVPNIGSIIAAVPPVVMALVTIGIWPAAGVAAGYVAINCLIGYVLEPRLLGRGLGLSTLVVFVGLIFWNFVLGPVGMLLSAPLTMVVKIILENYEDTRWLSVLLGPLVAEALEASDAKN